MAGKYVLLQCIEKCLFFFTWDDYNCTDPAFRPEVGGLEGSGGDAVEVIPIKIRMTAPTILKFIFIQQIHLTMHTIACRGIQIAYAPY